MALIPGTRFGAFELIEPSGRGRMARSIGRAIPSSIGMSRSKVLPEAFAHDPDRLARFEREAKTLASLNHPNIAQIHGLEKSTGTIALVMELVEWPTLAERIRRPSGLPVDEALPIAK